MGGVTRLKAWPKPIIGRNGKPKPKRRSAAAAPKAATDKKGVQ